MFNVYDNLTVESHHEYRTAHHVIAFCRNDLYVIKNRGFVPLTTSETPNRPDRVLAFQPGKPPVSLKLKRVSKLVDEALEEIVTLLSSPEGRQKMVPLLAQVIDFQLNQARKEACLAQSSQDNVIPRDYTQIPGTTDYVGVDVRLMGVKDFMSSVALCTETFLKLEKSLAMDYDFLPLPIEVVPHDRPDVRVIGFTLNQDYVGEAKPLNPGASA